MQSPHRSSNARPKAHSWHRTREGRVVYDRPRHAWSEGDFLRVSRAFLALPREPLSISALERFIEAITEWMLERVLGLVGLSSITDIVLDLLRSWVHSMLTWLGRLPLDDAARQRVNDVMAQSESFGGAK